nr:hypothetical protein Itr_chr13CG12560 [Ipomoea trifida]
MEVGRPLPELVDEVFDRVRDILVNLCLYVVRGDFGEELRPVDVERSRSAVEGDGVPSTLDFGSSSLRAPIASGDGDRVARLSTGGGGSTTEDGSLLAQVGQGLHPLRDYAPSGGSLREKTPLSRLMCFFIIFGRCTTPSFSSWLWFKISTTWPATRSAVQILVDGRNNQRPEVRASCMSFSLGLFSTFVLGGAGSDDDFVDPPSEFVGRPRNYKEEQREASPELELTLEEDGMFPTVQTRGSVKVLYNVIKSLNDR